MGGLSIVKLRIHVHKKAKQSVKIPQQSTKTNIILLPVLTVVFCQIKLSLIHFYCFLSFYEVSQTEI